MNVSETLKKHSDYLCRAIELIPAEIYFSSNIANKKYWHGKKGKKTKEQLKAETKKRKMAKLDPTQHKSNLDITKEKADKDKAVKASIDECNNTNEMKHNERTLHADVSTLKQTLQQKIQTLQRKRKMQTSHNSDEAIASKKLKRQNAKTKKSKKGSVVTKTVSADREKSKNNDRNIAKKSDAMLFSKFDVDTKNDHGGKKEKRKRTNLKKLLKIAETKDAKIKEIAKVDEIKAIETKDKMIWKSALEKAKGNKVKDNPKLLKKSIKRKESKKATSKRHWNDRIAAQQKATKERQQKRRKNISARIDHKKTKKIKKKR